MQATLGSPLTSRASRITQVQVQKVDPPSQTIDAFREVR